MSILSPDSKKKDCKFVGVQVPSRDYSYLNLYTMAKGVSKSKVVKEVLNKWANEERKKDNEVALLNEIANRINNRWKSLALITFEQFLEVVEHELKEKGLSSAHISYIISYIHK